MGLDPELAKVFHATSKISLGTDYGSGSDEVMNKAFESRRMDYLEDELQRCLKEAVETKERVMFTTALITGDAVILDAIAKGGYFDKIPIVFVDTYTLFPESLAHLREVENHYGFKAKVYAAAGCDDQEDYYNKYGRDYWMKDIDAYDMLCKVEPMNRALKEQDSDCWINGRRRDHGAERAALPLWEGKKLNALAMWTFEDCWNYCRRHNVPYHPLHDVGYSSLGDVHSTKKLTTRFGLHMEENAAAVSKSCRIRTVLPRLSVEFILKLRLMISISKSKMRRTCFLLVCVSFRSYCRKRKPLINTVVLHIRL